MKKIPGTNNQDETTQKEEDLTGDDLKQYEVDIEEVNLIIISILNDIYNYVDACQNARDMWNRVKRLMQGTELSEADRESCFVNEFDKFTAEPGESLSSVHNLFSQLINDMDRNKIKPFDITINTKLRLGMEMYKELYELLHQKMLYMFSATTAMLKNYEVEVILSDEQNNFLLADAAQMEELEELSANICMMVEIQKTYSDSDDGSSYDSAFI
ncbi:hypothetical protein Tco_1265805 [Tanacetum coccineum]